MTTSELDDLRRAVAALPNDDVGARLARAVLADRDALAERVRFLEQHRENANTAADSLYVRATAAEAEVARLREAIDYAIGQIDRGAPDNAGDELRRVVAALTPKQEKPDAPA